MVGDDLWSDVEGAQRAGLQGWLVRTGKFREAALQRLAASPPIGCSPSVAALALGEPDGGLSFAPLFTLECVLRFRHRPAAVDRLFVPLALAAQAAAVDSAHPPAPSRAATRCGAWSSTAGDIFDPDERGWVARVGNALAHPDPGGHHSPGAAVPAGRAVRLRARGRIRAEPPGARRLPARGRSTRCGPTRDWWPGCSPRTGGVPRPIGDSGAPAARWHSRSGWSRTTCSVRHRRRRCATRRPPTEAP